MRGSSKRPTDRRYPGGSGGPSAGRKRSVSIPGGAKMTRVAHLQGRGNLQSIGRNGLFTYNQMSHSVECGLRAAENVLGAHHAIEVPTEIDLRL